MHYLSGLNNLVLYYFLTIHIRSLGIPYSYILFFISVHDCVLFRYRSFLDIKC